MPAMAGCTVLYYIKFKNHNTVNRIDCSRHCKVSDPMPDCVRGQTWLAARRCHSNTIEVLPLLLVLLSRL